ncbi:MAG: UDP-glucose/GDP-mannose dehydrogenase family protein [Deltaproteobacteria bacterium]|nr:UDP-glucose/GDP-mannose dehydrogenase family protein [Deltaproteobacteria bacterium]
MLIQIVGAGVVGQATGRGFARFGHEVVFCDTDRRKLIPLGEEFETTAEPRDADVHFVCVPEGEVESTVEGLLSQLGLVVIRSTVPPGTARRMNEKGVHVCSNPEFLREAVAEYEFLNPHMVVIGECCPQHGDVLERLYRPFRAPIVRTDPTTAEMAKLAVNCHLACLISFWNEVHLICERLGVNSHEVGAIASLDPRVSPYGARMHGRPFGGRCLPKDLKQVLELCERVGYRPVLLEAVKRLNEEIW